MYSEKDLEFLLDPEDTVHFYESTGLAKGKIISLQHKEFPFKFFICQTFNNRFDQWILQLKYKYCTLKLVLNNYK